MIDPYKLLPSMLGDISSHDLELLMDDNEIREGGAAMTAYAKMQFEEMSDSREGSDTWCAAQVLRT